ncbi:MAG: ATP-binding protein [Bacillota bacterium]
MLLEKRVEERTELLKKSRSLLVTELEERLAAEEALRKSEFQFSLVWEKSTDGMRITDKDGIVIKVNDAYCRMTGKAKEEMEGKPFSTIYKNTEHPQVLARYKKRFQNREVEPHYEREFNLWDGRKAWFEVSSSYLEFESEVLLLLIFRNVTERKNAENELKKYASELEQLNMKLAESEAKLRELNAGKDKYFSIISHDLRSPFNALLGITDFLLKDYDSLSQDEIKNFLRSLYHSTRNVFHLLEDLLQWSRIQTGRLEINPANFRIDTLVSSNISLLAGNAVKKNIQIINEVNTPCSVYADENMISSVFQNLLSNAIKFTNPGGKISVSSDFEDDGLLKLTLIDNGIGISKELQSRLFKIETNHSTLGTLQEKGTGLGLIISKEFVEINGGKLTVRSEINAGTAFSFTLPLAQDNPLPTINL